jgi:hypothetical protein
MVVCVLKYILEIGIFSKIARGRDFIGIGVEDLRTFALDVAKTIIVY